MLKPIAPREIVHAQIALLLAIGLQFLVWRINDQLANVPLYIIFGEIIMALLLGFTATTKTSRSRSFHHTAAIALIAFISAINIGSLIFVVHSLIFGHNFLSGIQLLSSAIAIFLTNIIVYAIWYWEIDSPGLTRTKWSKHDKDFQFTQQDIPKEFPGWRPEFIDYIYLSTTNAVNFAPADSKPLTKTAKMLMASQALISVFTLALLIARSVNILG